MRRFYTLLHCIQFRNRYRVRKCEVMRETERWRRHGDTMIHCHDESTTARCAAVLTLELTRHARQAVRQSRQAGRRRPPTIRRAAVCPVIDRRRPVGLAACRTARQRAALRRQRFVIRWSLGRRSRSTALPPPYVRSPAADTGRAPTPTDRRRCRPTSSSTPTIAVRLSSAEPRPSSDVRLAAHRTTT